MNLLNKFQYCFVISLITSSFSTGGAEDTVESCEVHVCEGRTSEPCDPSNVPQDCYDIQQLCGESVCSGSYYVYPIINGEPLQVYCDMKTDGGGWLVFQRRDNGRENFYRDWIEYRSGFGNTAGEFWLGNEHLYELTEKNHFELRVDLQDFDGERRYATYDHFEIKGEGDQFKLLIGKYSGNAGDGLTVSHGVPFMTEDRDNASQCAAYFNMGAWWHYSCTSANLNGLYRYGPTDTDDYTGVFWEPFRGDHYSLQETEMKIRPYGV